MSKRCTYCDHHLGDHAGDGVGSGRDWDGHQCERYECRCPAFNYLEHRIWDTCRDCGHANSHDYYEDKTCHELDCDCPGFDHLPIIGCAEPPEMLERRRRARNRTWAGRLYEEATAPLMRYRQFVKFVPLLLLLGCSSIARTHCMGIYCSGVPEERCEHAGDLVVICTEDRVATYDKWAIWFGDMTSAVAEVFR